MAGLGLPLAAVAALVLDQAAAGGAAAGFSHDRWNRLLAAHVTVEGWVDYEALRGKGAAELKAYLKDLGDADPARLGDRNGRKAFWINAYNAVCIQTIIDHGVPEKVPHAVLFGANIFRERTYRVAGKVRSLDDIEHGILRKEYPDPRLHAAVVCGAQSCPRLRPEAYAGKSLDAQLDEEARSWITTEKTRSGERKNHLDAAKGIYFVSRIFDWYEEDFGGSADGVLEFLSKHGGEAVRAQIAGKKPRIRYIEYDWSTNRK